MSWQAVAAGAGGGFLIGGPLGATVGGLAAWWATQPASPSAAPAPAAAAPATSTVVALPLSPADSTSVSLGGSAAGAGAGGAGVVISMPIDNGSTAAAPAPAPVVTPVVMAPLTSLVDTGDQGGFTSAQVTASSASSTPSSIGIIATSSAPPLLSIVPTPVPISVPTPVKPVMSFPDPNLPENSGGFMPPNLGGAGGLLIRPMNPVISAPVTTMPIIQRDTGADSGPMRPTTGTVVSAPRPVAPIRATPAVNGLGVYGGAFGDTAGGALGDTLGSVGGLLLLGAAIYAGVNLLKA